jgi:hypothetical protein
MSIKLKDTANITANSASSATSATKATQDSAGQQINTTYIKGLSVSGKTITYTKGDGSTGTITTQDTNTTYSAATQSAAGLMSAADKKKLDGVATSANNYSHPNSGVTAASYGPSANASPAHSGTFSVPYITVNSAGHITAASTKTITLPADNNTWRPIQNNLTSTATDQSLSANQGKVLKGLIDSHTGTTHLTIGTGASNAAAGNHTHSGYAASSHTHSNIVHKDTRDVNTTPDGAPEGLSVHLKNNGTDGLSDGGTYHSSLFIKGWDDYSGGPYGNIAISANNNLWYRASSSGTAWNSWKKVSVDGHTHSYLPLSGGTVTGNIEVSSDVNAGLFRPKYAVGPQNCYIGGGNGDAASWDSHNMVIRSHWGIGFRDYQDICRIVMDTRAGSISSQGNLYSGGQLLSEAGLYTNGTVTSAGTITANSDLVCNGRAWIYNATLSGMFIGEHKFSVDGAYADPWNGIGCAIKAYGNVGLTGTLRANAGIYSTSGNGAATADGSTYVALFRHKDSRGYCDIGNNNIPGRIYLRSGQGTAGSGVLIENRVTDGNAYMQYLSPEAGTIALTRHLSDRTKKENIVYVGSEESEFTNKDFYDFIKDDLGLATYNYNEEYKTTDTHTKLNFIAQDILYDIEHNCINKVGNLIVQTEDAMEQQGSLRYDPEIYTSVIAGALKESISKIEEDNEKIKTLENEIKELEAKNKVLEELVYSMNERLSKLEDK